MNQKVKRSLWLMGGLVVVLLGGGVAFCLLPAGESTPTQPLTYVKDTQEEKKPLHVPENVKEEGDRFVQMFFSFDPQVVEKIPEYSFALEDCHHYFQTYGYGQNLQKELVDATKESTGEYLLTYEVSGTFGKEKLSKQSFSLVLNLSLSEGSVQIANASVVCHA